MYLNLISHEFELNTALKKMLPLNKCHIENNVFSMFNSQVNTFTLQIQISVNISTTTHHKFSEL